MLLYWHYILAHSSPDGTAFDVVQFRHQFFLHPIIVRVKSVLFRLLGGVKAATRAGTLSR